MTIATLLPLLLLVSSMSFIDAARPTDTDQTQSVDGDQPSTRKLNRLLRRVHPAFFLCGGNSYCFKRTMDCVDGKCQCKDGLVFDEDRRHCNEIDECKIDNICTTDAFCVDRFLSQFGHKCECYPGFESILGELDSTRMVDGIETGFFKGAPITLRPKFCAWGGEKNIVIEAIMNLGEFTDASLAKLVAVEYFKSLLEAAGVTLSLDKSSEATRTFYPVVIGNSVDVSDSVLEITFHVILSSKISERDIIVEDDIDISLELPDGSVIVFGQSVVSGEGAAYIADKINDATEQVVEIQFNLSQVLYFVVENGMTLLSVPSSFPSLLPSITSSLDPTVTPTESPVDPTESPTTPTESPVDPTESPITPTESPTSSTQSPTSSTQSPTSSTESPTLSPTSSTESPTSSSTLLYVLTGTGKHTKFDDTRLFRDFTSQTVDECALRCRAFPGCTEFSSDDGDCIGGEGSSSFKDDDDWNTYSMNIFEPVGSSQPYTLFLEDQRIPNGDRSFVTADSVRNTLIECYELCKAESGCYQFSWGSEAVAEPKNIGRCIGANGSILSLSDKTGFMTFNLDD